MIGHLIKYSDFYNTQSIESALEIVKCIPKEELLTTIAAINAKLKPVFRSNFDDSRSTQIECLRLVFLDSKNHISNSNCKNFISKYIQTPKNYNLFSRVTCLYAFQDILSSSDFAKYERIEYTIGEREKILKYLLAINESILLYDSEYNEGDKDRLGDSIFEYLMFKEIPHNQYYQTSNPINLFYKSWKLFKAIQMNEFYSVHLKDFLKISYGTDNLTDFFKNHLGAYFLSYDKDFGFNFMNVKDSDYELKQILDNFSIPQEIKTYNKGDLRLFDFLCLKKSPLYKSEVKDDKNFTTYIVLDSTLLLEKTYSLFVNDFWFDYLKPNNICKRSDWGNFIGSNFFEPFLEEIFYHSFKNNKRIVYRSTDALKFKLNGRDLIEYADFYIRERGKIILSQAKSNYLPVINGYKTVNNIDDFASLDLEKFYEDYGLTQLANKTIKLYHEYKFFINDISFNFVRKVKIFPTLIVNDPILCLGVASFTFQEKFKKILGENGVEIESEKHTILPLTIVNVSDLQDIEQSLQDGNENIFNIFRYFHSISSLKRAPFAGSTVDFKTVQNAINKRIKSKLIARRIKRFKWLNES